MIYFPQIAPNLKKLPPEEVAHRILEYNSANDADLKDRKRGIRNMQLATGLGNDQWPKDLAGEMEREGRSPRTYNFIQFYIRGLAGNYITNWFDPKFIDREDDSKNVQDTLNQLHRIYYANKEHFNYKNSVIDCIWNGLTYRGVEEIKIDRREDTRGSIVFEPLRPDDVLFDPSYRGSNISRESRRAWKKFYLTPKEMVNYYPHMEKEVRDKLALIYGGKNEDAERYDRQYLEYFQKDLEYFGNKFLTIEDYYFEDKKQKVVIDRNTGTMLPDFGFDLGSQEDYLAKVLWGQENGLTLTPESFLVIDKKIPTLMVCTFVKSLGLILENREDERQLNGHLPFYAWSFIQKYGKSIGVVDLLADAQEDINKREAAKTKIITQSPIAGKTWMHPMLYGNNDQKRRDFIDNFNDISKVVELDEDAPIGAELFGVMPGTNIPAGYLNDETTKIDYMNRMSSLPLALQGITERSGESGIHLGRRVIEANVMQKLPMESLIQHENNKAEDWLRLAIKIYGGKENYNRIFTGATDKNKVVANEVIDIDENGVEQIKYDISKLKRVDVIITQTKENDYVKQAKREIDAAILSSIPPTDSNGGTIAAFVSDLINSSDFADEDQKNKAIEAASLYYNLELERGYTLLAQAKLSRLQSETQISQAMAALQQGQMPGAAPEVQQGRPAPAPEEIEPSLTEIEELERPPVPEVERPQVL